MLKNYFRIALRNLRKHKFYTAINLFGLTTGLTVGIFILFWVQDELSFDKFHQKADRIYQVATNVATANVVKTWESTQGPVAWYASQKIPGVNRAVRVKHNYSYSLFRNGNKEFTEDRLAYVDSTFFTVFDFKLVKGVPDNPFPNNNSIVISESVAERYFGKEDPIGKTLLADNETLFVVDGVMMDFPKNSSLQYDILFPVSLFANSRYNEKSYWKSMDTDWGNFGFLTFLEVRPGASVEAIADKLSRFYDENTSFPVEKESYVLQPLKNMHLYTPDGGNAGMRKVKLFLIVPIFILAIAAINYVNISTARSMLRSKEVGVRKVIGANRGQLFTQFIIETVLVFLFVTLVTLLLIRLLTPWFNTASGKELQFNWSDPHFWKVIVPAFIVTLAASAIYPALLMSSFKPLQTLKGRLLPNVTASAFRKGLVIIQFVFSITLIVSTIVVGKQLSYIQHKELGYDRSQVFYFGMKKMYGHYDAAREELMRVPAVQGVTSCNTNILNSGKTTGDTDWAGKDPGMSFVVSPFGVDENFVQLLNMEIVAGRDFRSGKADSAHFILNETAVKAAGITDPIGKRFELWETDGTIIGVVKDFHFGSLKNKIAPAVLFYQPTNWHMYIKTTGRDASKAIAAAETQWNRYNPDFPFEYHFLDESYDQMYRAEQLSGTLFRLFSFVAIFISCLGLFGLTAYMAQMKTKEIGVRKVLGASVTNVVTLLSKDFIRLVLIAFLVATPLAWYAMNRWLRDFEYRIELEWWMFALAGLLAVIIALLTVSFQSVKAALVNPVKSLRSE